MTRGRTIIGPCCSLDSVSPFGVGGITFGANGRGLSLFTHMPELTYVELFAGAGGMSLGLEMAGWRCTGHAEIEEAPRKVLTARWPGVPLYGDVTQLTGADIGSPLMLTGGSPCQDLSIAGKRAGMTEGSGTRSSLFFHQMRLWGECGADLCLWENVLGAFSSNKGQDFAAVLSAFVGGAVPVPTTGRWSRGGVVCGPAGIAAWRVLDAQYFGVPQRRRRAFVLGTRSGRYDPAEILALSEGVSGNTEPRQETWQDASPQSSRSAGTVGDSLTPWDYQSKRTYQTEGVFPALAAAEKSGQQQPPVIAFHATQTPVSGDVAPSLGATAKIGVVDKHSGGSSFDVTRTLTTDTAHAMGPCVFTKRQYGSYEDSPNVASTLGARDHASQNTDVVVSASLRARAPRDSSDLSTEVTLPVTDTGRPRRLTPLECERLMGWPDGHTKLDGLTDTPRYKMLGNGIAAPVAAWIGFRIREAVTP